MKNNKETSQFYKFCKELWYVLVALALLPVVGTGLYCLVFRHELMNAGAWGSLIAGLFTYFGTIGLGLFTFYHSWQQEKVLSSLQEAKADIVLHAANDNDYFVPYDEIELAREFVLPYKSEKLEHSTAQGREIKDWGFLGFSIRNINHLVNFSVQIVGVFFVNNDHKVQKVKNRIKIWASNKDEPIDYKQTCLYFIGCDAKLLNNRYMETQQYSNWFVVFSITDSNMKRKYVICDYVLGKTFGIAKSMISDEEYEKRIRTHGTPIILKGYNKQFFN